MTDTCILWFVLQEDLLHKVMSVFTFMGANVMRQDDQYSFHIINRILETVVPALVTVSLSFHGWSELRFETSEILLD